MIALTSNPDSIAALNTILPTPLNPFIPIFGGNILVGEGELLGIRFEEEVEGVVGFEICYQVDDYLKFVGLLWNDEPGQIIPIRVLLPIDEVISAKQKYGDYILNEAFRLTRTWCFVIHKARMKMLGRWPH